MTTRSFLTLIAISFALASCRNPRTTESSSSGGTPSAVRPDDIAAITAFVKSGGKGGFYLATNKMDGPLTPANAAFIVDLDTQRAYLYQNAKLVAYSPISSGRKFYRTETGNYTIGEKDLNHRSSSYGNFVSRSGSTIMGDVQEGFDPTPVGARFEGSLMKWFMRFQYKGSPTAMGFHRGVLPGYPASHGCVRLPAKMAEWFFANVPSGTPMLVRGKSNGVPIGARQNRPKRSPRVHSSLKKPKKPVDAVPSAPESDIKPSIPLTEPAEAPPAPEPTPAPADAGIPAPAPSPDPTANEPSKEQ